MINIFLDDLRETPCGFERTYNVADTIKYLVEYQNKVDILSLDNDLGEHQEEGYKVLDWLEEEVFKNGNIKFLPKTIRIHSANPVAAKRMRSIIERLY